MGTLLIILTSIGAVLIGLTIGHVVACLFILKRPPFLLPWFPLAAKNRHKIGDPLVAGLRDFQNRIEAEDYRREHDGKDWSADDMFGIDEGWGEAVDDLIDEG